MHKHDHDDSHTTVKNALLTTGIIALAAGSIAWLLADERNRVKAKEIGNQLLERGKEYVQKVAEQRDKQMLT